MSTTQVPLDQMLGVGAGATPLKQSAQQDQPKDKDKKKTNPPNVPPPAEPKTLESDEDIMRDNIALMDQLSYDGFNASLIRQKIIDGCDGSRSKIIKVLITYIECGNNFTERLKNVSDPDVGKLVTAEMRSLGIGKVISSKESLTMARIAQTMPFAVLRLRMMMSTQNKLPNVSVSTTTPPALADLALSSLSDIQESIKDFLEKMAIELNNHAKRSKRVDAFETDAEAVSNMHRFRKLATQNLRNDPAYSFFKNEVSKTKLSELLFRYGFDQP